MRDIIGDVDELLTTVRHVTRGLVQQIQRESEQQVEDIRREAAERAEDARRKILQDAHRRASGILRRRREETRHEEKDNFLRAREEILQQVWEEAERELHSLTKREDEYALVLRQLALAAIDLLGSGQWVLATDEQGMELLNDEQLKQWADEGSRRVGGNVSLERAAEPADTWGGLLVSAKDGRCRADARFPVRLQYAREDIRGDVLKQLVKT